MGSDEETSEVSQGFTYLINLAFFIANFGYSKADFDVLRPVEVAFIMKAWEDRQVRETSLQNKSQMNAIANVMRKKGTRYMKLWEKKVQRTDPDLQQARVSFIEEIEKDQGKSWVEEIYKANRRKGVTNVRISSKS